MLRSTPKKRFRSTIAHQGVLLCTAAALAACAETTSTVKIPVNEFIEITSHEAPSAHDGPIVKTIDGSRERLTGPIERYRIVHKSGVLQVVPPVLAYDEGLHLGLITADNRRIELSNVSHVAVDYRPPATSGSKRVGIALLAVGTPVLAVSTLFFVGALMTRGEGAIPVLFVSPLVSLGATALVVPGLVLVRKAEPTRSKNTVWTRPMLHVLPNGVVMTTAF